MSKETIKNVVANFGGKLVTMLSSYLFIPLYISYLGSEMYGLVTFYATLQSAMLLLGMGLSSTLRREFADIQNSNDYKYKLLRVVEVCYIAVMLVIMAICHFGNNFIATKWLNIGALDPKIVQNAISLMGVSIAFHLLSNLYSGCLLGDGRQGVANIMQAVWAIARSGGAVLVLAFIKIDILLFLGAQIVTDAIYVIALRKVLILHIKNKQGLHLSDFCVLKDVWKYTVGIFGVSIISLINTQLDKVLIASYYSLTDVGVYSTAYTFSQIPNSIVTILMVAIYNELIHVCKSEGKEEKTRVYNMYYRYIQMLTAVLVTYMLVFSLELLATWTQDYQISFAANAPARILLIGTLALSMQQVPYYFLLAVGTTKYNNIMGIFSLAINFLVTPSLIGIMGMRGAAVAFAGLRMLEFLFLSVVVEKQYLHNSYWKWLKKNVLIVITIVLIIAIPIQFIIKCISNQTLVTLALAILGGGVTLVCSWIVLFHHKL